MWVKLTDDHDGDEIYVNLDRFDRMWKITGEHGTPVTRIVAALSVTDEDSLMVDVRETPEQIINSVVKL